jgi:hypothetical protein
MKWNTWMLGPVAAVLLAGCGGGGRNANTAGSTAGGSETGMQGTAADTAAMTATDSSRMRSATDTGMKARTGTTSDTGMSADTGRTAKNQSQSGVTNKSGKSTMGNKVTKARPDQNQPVTSKGDTISNNADTSVSKPK